jgi:hypothetical protein
MTDGALIRPGFTGLCDVLQLADSFAAVLISDKHLSPGWLVADHLARQIRDTGARLLFVRGTVTEAPAAAMSRTCAQLPEWWQ